MNLTRVWSLFVLAVSAAGLAWAARSWVRKRRRARRLDRLRKFLDP